jgi:hypothetical protein
VFIVGAIMLALLRMKSIFTATNGVINKIIIMLTETM